MRHGTKRKSLLILAAVGAIAVGGAVAPSMADHVRVTPSGTVYGPGVVGAPPAPVTVIPAQPAPVTVIQAPPAPTTVVPVPAAAVSAPTTVVVPSPSTVVVPSAATSAEPTTIRVEQIRANRVRAGTIYANRIETDRMKATVHHHASMVSVSAPQPGEIVNGEVVASVIYADAIAANFIEADNVYVLDLEMSPSQFSIAPLTGTIVRRQSP